MGLQPVNPNRRVARSLAFLPERKSKDFGQSNHIETLENNKIVMGFHRSDDLSKDLFRVNGFVESEMESVVDLDAADDAKSSVAHTHSNSAPDQKRFQLLSECEAKFLAIIWDVGFLDSGDVYICCGDGIAFCDCNLKVKTKLDRIKLAGGAAVMPRSGNFVAIDRFNDTVNIYSSDGQFISSFLAGSSPMNVAVTKDGCIAVTDIGDKCVRLYSTEGTLLNTITQRGRGYELQWPLYIQAYSDNSLVVSDVLQRKVFAFDEHGNCLKALQLRTSGADSVLRPHGICKTKNDAIFVVDNALNTIEAFGRDDNYIETILSSEEGAVIKPKVMGMSKDGRLIVGGMTGSVKLYTLIEREVKVQVINKEEAIKLHDASVDTAAVDIRDQINKIETKQEYFNNDCIIVID